MSAHFGVEANYSSIGYVRSVAVMNYEAEGGRTLAVCVPKAFHQRGFIFFEAIVELSFLNFSAVDER